MRKALLAALLLPGCTVFDGDGLGGQMRNAALIAVEYRCADIRARYSDARADLGPSGADINPDEARQINDAVDGLERVAAREAGAGLGLIPLVSEKGFRAYVARCFKEGLQ